MKRLVVGAVSMLLIASCANDQVEPKEATATPAPTSTASVTPSPTVTQSPTPTTIVVPDIRGMTGDAARSALIDLGLRGAFAPIDNPPEKYNRGHWIVESQTPKPGTSLEAKGEVTFVVAQIGPFASEVVEAFEAQGLPVTNPRDNTSQNCYGLTSDCVLLITTDDISVYEFADEAAATKMASAFGASGAHRNRTIVLGYLAARTPDALKPRYEASLAKLMTNY